MYAKKNKKLGNYKANTKNVFGLRLGLTALVLLTVGALCLTSFSPVAATDGYDFNGQLLTPDERGVIPEIGRGYPVEDAMVKGADYVKHAQADITEDNAGNGNPDIDPEDGGWNWMLTAPIFTHSATASSTNLYGATAQGLYYAYLDTSDATYKTCLDDAANHMITDPAIDSAADLIFLMLYDDLPSVSGTTYQAAAKTKYDATITTYGNATNFGEYIRDFRHGQGYDNGIIAWDIGAWAKAAAMLNARYPGNNYDGNATEFAEVIWQDSFNDNPGYFDIIDCQTDGSYWYPLGISGLIDAFSYAGAHTAEIPGLLIILLDCQCPSGGFSDYYGGNPGDEDWQGTAYAVLSLGDLDQATYQTVINSACVWLAGTQDPGSGGWVYSSGNHYPEVGGECTAALYYYLDTGVPTIDFIPDTPDDGGNASICIDITVDTGDPEYSPLTAFVNWNYTLVGYWPFMEGTGTTVEDNSTYTNDGTITGATWVPGKFGYGLYFDGTTGDYVSVPSVGISSGSFTIEGWVKPDLDHFAASYGTFMGYSGTHRILIQSSGKLLTQFGTSFFSTGTVADDTWSHIAYIYDADANTENFYINGALDNSQTPSTTPTWNAAFYIGQYDLVNYPFNGSIDEVKIWKRALSLAEIQASYDNNNYPLDITICGLEDGQTYHYYAQVQDEAGNMNWTETRVVYGDLMPPEMTVEIGSPTYMVGSDVYANCMTPIWFNATDTQSGAWRIRPQIQIYDTGTAKWVNEYLAWIYDGSVNDLDPVYGSISYMRTFATDCYHRIRMVCADDYVLNRNATGAARVFQYYYVDCTPAVTTKVVGDPSYQNGYWVKTTTPIWLNATDPGTCASGVASIYYEVYWDSDGDGVVDTLVDSDTVLGDSAVIYLANEGINTISWYSIDNLGNIEAIKPAGGPQEHYVDDTAPVLNVDVGEPKCDGYTPGVEYCISSDTPIWINVTDEQALNFNPGRGVTLYYNITYDGVMYPSTASDDVTFTFGDFGWSDDCDHILTVEAVDDLGNNVTLDPILFHVDDTGPGVPSKVMDPEPVILDGKSYVTSDTLFTFTANDYAGSCVCGVAELHFIIDGDHYMVEDYTVTVTLGELGYGEGEHIVEFWAVDCVGNEGTHHTQTHYIDDFAPTSYKIFNGPVCGNVPHIPDWVLLKNYDYSGGSVETWNHEVIDLSDYAGYTIQLAWQVYSDNEFYAGIDDVQILDDGLVMYSENFDSYVDDGYYTPGPFPPGWTAEHYGTPCGSPTYYKHWGAESYKSNSAPNMMGIYYNCPNDDWIITPEFNLSDGDGSYALDYYIFDDNYWDELYNLYIKVLPSGEEGPEGPVWVTSDTEICFNSFDTASGVESLYIEVWWDSDNNGSVDTMTDQRYIKDNYLNDGNPDVGKISYCLTLPEECTHEIIYYATDYFGHVEMEHLEIDHVDNTAPEVNKTFDGPGTLEYLFLNTETVITLEATDLPGPYVNATGGGGGGGGGGEYIYDNDFETDDGDWIVDTVVADWEWTNTYDVGLYTGTNTPPPNAHSGTGLWGTVLYDDYTNSGSETTLSQTFDFTGYSNVYLSFASWSDLFGDWDYGQVLVNGNEVFYVDTYDPTAWTEENISLSAYDGMSNVEVVFSMHASTVVEYAGWYIDDVRIGGDGALFSREMIEDFEQGPPWPWSPWVAYGSGGTVSTAAAHDGTYGIINPGWHYRTDVVLGEAGDVLSCWGRFTGSGRIYFGFAASSGGCYSFVAAPNTANIIIQQNSGYGYDNLVEVPHSWEYNKWYRLEVVFDSTTDVTCNLYDSDGTTLLNTVSYSGISGLPGGIAIRSFGGQHIDTIEKLGAAGPDLPEGCASGTVLIEYRIWANGTWGNWTTYYDAYNSSAGTGPFNFTEGCMHYLQYRAVDCLGNTLLCEDDLIDRDKETETLLEEGFEDSLFPPMGWDQTIYDSAATWERYTGLTFLEGDTSRGDGGGLKEPKEPQGSWCACVWWDYYEQDEWLFTTDPIDLSGYTEADLKFYTYNYDSVGWVEHDYVKVSTDGGSNWDTLGDMAWDYPNHFWGAEIVYELDGYCGRDEIVIGFHRVTPDGGSGAWGIDHVRVEADTGDGGNGGDNESEALPITVYNQTHYVDLEPPMSWIELELDHDGNIITPYTEFMIWQEDFACNQTGGSQCCTIHFRIDGPPGSMFYWEGKYLAADGSWKTGDTGFDTPIAFQIRDSTGYIKAGKYVVEYYAEDCLGNTEPTIHRQTYYPDTTAPTTTLLFSGPLYHGDYDWINEETTINLMSDDHQGSGVLVITYRIDDGAEKTYNGPFTLSGDGLHTIQYYAKDQVNHAEPVQTKRMMVDSSGPDATLSFTGDTYTTSSVTWITGETTVGVLGGDDGVGLDTIYYRSNDGSWQEYQGSFTLGEGSYVVKCYGVDKLGNSGPIGQVSVGVDTSAPSVTYQSPKTSHLYIAGREIMVLPTSMDVDAVIIGPTTISATAVDSGVGVERVELYIDGELRYSSPGDSLEFVWNQRTFLKHTLEVVTVDFFGYTSSKTIDLWVFNL